MTNNTHIYKYIIGMHIDFEILNLQRITSKTYPWNDRCIVSESTFNLFTLQLLPI